VAGEPWPVLGLFYFFGLTSLLLLYPAADFWHVVMGLPAWLPLLAFQLERFRCPPDARGRPGRTERRSALLVAILVLALCAPFVDTLRFVQRTQHGEAPLARASGIVGWPPRFTEAVEVIRYLDSLPKEAPLLVIANEQMIYFLAGRSSVITDGEYVLYLVGADAIAGDDARALLPEQRLIERLESAKPLIVDYTGNPMSQRFRNAFPRTATYVEIRYRLQQAVGQYRVLAWAGA
jgi:hypothetical protein